MQINIVRVKLPGKPWSLSNQTLLLFPLQCYVILNNLSDGGGEEEQNYLPDLPEAMECETIKNFMLICCGIGEQREKETVEWKFHFNPRLKLNTILFIAHEINFQCDGRGTLKRAIVEKHQRLSEEKFLKTHFGLLKCFHKKLCLSARNSSRSLFPI